MKQSFEKTTNGEARTPPEAQKAVQEYLAKQKAANPGVPATVAK